MGKELLEPKRITRDELITLGDLHDFHSSLLSEIKLLLKSNGTASAKQWLRSAEVRKMLGVSAGTLQNLRINGTLTFTRIGGIVFYKHEDIIKVLEKNASR
ncbi:MAG TPA: helix-turn-helix domain-containing protein [Cyclobacteriaceae bacterium]|nr:helix-turn-helix domain-containing protein [Cyclobacteriaceae bacterium]HRF34409.1 helix-turn-helix domain-containing protein [Cyclobacteriaceae bacterium]